MRQNVESTLKCFVDSYARNILKKYVNRTFLTMIDATVDLFCVWKIIRQNDKRYDKNIINNISKIVINEADYINYFVINEAKYIKYFEVF